MDLITGSLTLFFFSLFDAFTLGVSTVVILKIFYKAFPQTDKKALELVPLFVVSAFFLAGLLRIIFK